MLKALNFPSGTANMEINMDTNSALIFVIYFLVVFAGAYSTPMLHKIRRTSLRQERKLDAILKHLNLDWQSECDPKVLELIRAGTKIEAVKAYKESSGVEVKATPADWQRYGRLE